MHASTYGFSSSRKRPTKLRCHQHIAHLCEHLAKHENKDRISYRLTRTTPSKHAVTLAEPSKLNHVSSFHATHQLMQSGAQASTLQQRTNNGFYAFDLAFHLVFASSPEDQQRLRLCHTGVDCEPMLLRSFAEVVNRTSLLRVLKPDEIDTVIRMGQFRALCSQVCTLSTYGFSSSRSVQPNPAAINTLRTSSSTSPNMRTKTKSAIGSPGRHPPNMPVTLAEPSKLNHVSSFMPRTS